MIYIDHWIAQLKGVEFNTLKDKETLLNKALTSAKKLKLTIVSSHVHEFKPHGLSLALIIAESHFAIHTWPELGYMHIDVFSCAQGSNLHQLEKILVEQFSPEEIIVEKLEY